MVKNKPVIKSVRLVRLNYSGVFVKLDEESSYQLRIKRELNMNKKNRNISLLFSLLAMFIGNQSLLANEYKNGAANEFSNQVKTLGSVVVANRASGSISIINSSDNIIKRTISLPQAENPSQPMYVVYKNGRIFVGDRGNNRVVVFDSASYALITSIPAGAGVFHMWASQFTGKLMVNNDIDNSVTVIDTYSLTVDHTFSIPSDLVAMGFKPHDIFVSANGRSVFISLVDGVAGNDYVIKVRSSDYKEVARQEVGGDPHLFISSANPSQLFVPSQDSGALNILNEKNLKVSKTIPLAGAHGIFSIGSRLYVTNIPNGGIDGVYTFDLDKKAQMDSVNLSFAVPHNIAVSDDGRKIYVTHSGASSNKVSVLVTRPGTQD